MKSIARPAAAGISALLLFAALASAPAQKPAPAAVGAYAKVSKLIDAKCIGCHRGATAAGHVDLSSYAEVMKAKFKGKLIVIKKKPKDSVLSKAVHGAGVMKMPPGGALSPAEIATIDAWITAGAKK